MVGLSKVRSPEVRRRRLAKLRREYAFWMAGAGHVKPGSAVRRVVRMRDDSLLNRYFDDKDPPRDESWRKDTLTAGEATPCAAADVYRDLRASAESGWISARAGWPMAHWRQSLRPRGRRPLGFNSWRRAELPDPVEIAAVQHQIQDPPSDALFLLGSRYCETNRLSDEAGRLFEDTPLGWARVQAVCCLRRKP